MSQEASAAAVGILAPPVVRAPTVLRQSSAFDWQPDRVVDWLVYASFSLCFAKSFFPNGNQTAQLLSTAAIFAVGYLMRPIAGRSTRR